MVEQIWFNEAVQIGMWSLLPLSSSILSFVYFYLMSSEYWRLRQIDVPSDEFQFKKKKKRLASDDFKTLIEA